MAWEGLKLGTILFFIRKGFLKLQKAQDSDRKKVFSLLNDSTVPTAVLIKDKGNEQYRFEFANDGFLYQF